MPGCWLPSAASCLAYLAVYWFGVALEEGFNTEGSFALVGYAVSAGFAVAAFLCFRIALDRRTNR